MDLSFTPTRTPFARPASASTTRSRTASGCGSSSPSGSTRLWDAVAGMGLPVMALAEAAGGAGASLTDLAAAVEVHGAHCGLVPLVEGAVAARLLAAGPAGASARRRRRGGGGDLRAAPGAAGVARLVPFAARAQVVVALDGDRLVVAVDAGTTERRTLAGMAAADVDLAGASVLAEGDAAHEAFERARDEWRSLTAVAQAGLGRATLDVGVQYAKDRHQFGVPIGSFQSLQHRFADLHERVDGSRLLAYQAIWALDEADPSAPGRAAQASWYCGQVAEEAAGFSLHVHGGYGFMLEYDVQLHVRRAKAARLVLGDARHELRTIAARRWGPDAPDPAVLAAAATARPTRAGMDFRVDPETEAFRAEVRGLHRRPPHPRGGGAGADHGTMHDWGFHQALCERGYLAAGWPKEVGGLGRSAIDQVVLNQELYASGAPIDGLNIASMVGATLLLQGTDEHRREVLPGSWPGRSSRASATASPTPGPMSPRSPRGPCATATAG